MSEKCRYQYRDRRECCDVRFSNSMITGDAIFSKVAIGGSAWFEGCNAGGTLRFTGAKIKNDGRFAGARIVGTADFTKLMAGGTLSFSASRIVGFLGYRSVNRNVHKFLSCFRIKFAAIRMNWSKQLDAPPTELKRYGIADLQEFLSISDILYVPLPLTRLTDGLIKTEELELLGENGIIISLGQVIEEEALYTALKDKLIAGAGIDVWYNYRPEEDEKGREYPYSFPFHELDNVVLSPHRAASPFDDLERWDEVIDNIRRFYEGSADFQNIVDLDAGY